MIKKIKIKIKKNLEIFCLISVLLITVIFTSYYNYNKKIIINNYGDLLENVYLKKSINHLFNNLEPRFKKVEHVVNVGETFDRIMEQYSVNQFEIKQIKKELSKDRVVRDAIQNFPGMRILRQEPFQCYISFIVSSNSNIPNIQTRLQNLCQKFGKKKIQEEILEEEC